ncbi:MAG: hypothetical protein R3C24_05670 [Cyanobacteriota/Melainabacteria group bacterium]
MHSDKEIDATARSLRSGVQISFVVGTAYGKGIKIYRDQFF